jgi:hypothetical protein
MPNRAFREAPLLFAALFIAFVIWLIAMQGDRETSWVSVSITLTDVAGNMKVEIVSPRSASAELNVQFPKEERSRIVPRNFAVEIPVDEVISADPEQWAQAGDVKTVRYNLSRLNVLHPSLPPEVSVIRIDPDRVELLASLRTLALTVEVPTIGELPAQYELSNEVIPQPGRVNVTGSEAVLEELKAQGARIRTQPLDLSKITKSDQILSELAVPEGVRLMDRLNSRVAVNIGLQERSETRIFDDVPIAIAVLSPQLTARITPPTAAITVEGPPSALNKISNESFTFELARGLVEEPGRRQEVGLAARFRRQQQEDFRLSKIIQTNPSLISVEFVAANEQNPPLEPPPETQE